MFYGLPAEAAEKIYFESYIAELKKERRRETNLRRKAEKEKLANIERNAKGVKDQPQ